MLTPGRPPPTCTRATRGPKLVLTPRLETRTRTPGASRTDIPNKRTLPGLSAAMPNHSSHPRQIPQLAPERRSQPLDGCVRRLSLARCVRHVTADQEHLAPTTHDMRLLGMCAPQTARGTRDPAVRFIDHRPIGRLRRCARSAAPTGTGGVGPWRYRSREAPPGAMPRLASTGCLPADFWILANAAGPSATPHCSARPTR